MSNPGLGSHLKSTTSEWATLCATRATVVHCFRLLSQSLATKSQKSSCSQNKISKVLLLQEKGEAQDGNVKHAITARLIAECQHQIMECYWRWVLVTTRCQKKNHGVRLKKCPFNNAMLPGKKIMEWYWKRVLVTTLRWHTRTHTHTHTHCGDRLSPY